MEEFLFSSRGVEGRGGKLIIALYLGSATFATLFGKWKEMKFREIFLCSFYFFGF